MSETFKRVQEDFVCEHCGVEVRGNGYTNHCPECLWSKHVDINPGDRAEGCNGLMKPVNLEQKAGEFVITHACEGCGKTRPNRAAPGDNLASLLSA